MIKYLLLKLIEFIYDEELEMSWLYQHIIQEGQTKNKEGVIYELSNYL